MFEQNIENAVLQKRPVKQLVPLDSKTIDGYVNMVMPTNKT